MCPPYGFHIIASTIPLCRWRLNKIDVKTAFLQTGDAQRHVYVTLSVDNDGSDKCLWLPLTASYGLFKANVI